MIERSIKSAIEALLLASSSPLTLDKLMELSEVDDKAVIEETIRELSQDYQTHVLQLRRVASGYRFQIREQYSYWVSKLYGEKPQKYSRAVLETLAIIAYRQPVTRGDIEAIRGVSVSSSIIKSLLEREWIKVAGHREVPGRPAVYITTRQFLDYFNLARLDDLPSLETLLPKKEEQSMEESLLSLQMEDSRQQTQSNSAEPCFRPILIEEEIE